jgi:hypothetical protein
MICTIVGIIVSCLLDPAVKPTPAQAAKILAQAPGISNRTGWTPVVEERRRPQVVNVPAPHVQAPPAPLAESDTARAIRMGIPGGYTPLEWAVIHSSR